MRLLFILLAAAMLAAAQPDLSKSRETYSPEEWPVYFSRSIQGSVTVCIDVDPGRSASYKLWVQPATEVKLIVDGKEARATPEPVWSVTGEGIGFGKHTIEISVGTPAAYAHLTLMGGGPNGQDTTVVRLCGEDAPPMGLYRFKGTRRGAFAFSGNMPEPIVVFRPEPEYCEEARKAKLQGTVLLAVLVDTDGKAKKIHLLGPPLGKGLDEKAIEAVTRWRFKPGNKNGHPITVMATAEVNFRLW